MPSTHDAAHRSGLGMLPAAFGTVVAASAAPYGYTVSIWSSGAVLMHRRGVPDVFDVFLFAIGALSGFAVLGLLAHKVVATSEQLGGARERVLAGMLHWLAVGVAVGAAALLAEIPGRVTWGVGSFAATSLYILGASVQLALVVGAGRVAEPREGTPPTRRHR
jgi:hypothetical protein